MCRSELIPSGPSTALSVVQQERAAFGLRSHDYPRYRKHCASKLHHLRQHLHATHGKGREYKKLPAVPLGKAQDGHVLIHLFEAERAFSHAQELLASKDSPEKHHAIARFRRALHHTSSLLGYLLRLPAQAQAELGAYSLMLRARYAIAKGDEELYNPALVQLATARLLLQALADAAGSSRDVALYTSFLDSTAPEPAEAGPDDRTCLAIIKSLDAVLQSLEQMRALPLAEESAGVAQGLEGRLEYTRAKRIGYLARLYASQNSYGEALALLSRGTIYLRALASSSSSSSLASPTPELAFYPLPVPLSDALGKQLAALELRLKKEWYAATRPKPVFYDVAFNYVKQPGERVRQRAGLPAELAAGVMGVVGSAAGAAGNAAAGAGKALAGAGTKAVGKVEAAAGVGEKRQQVEEEPVAGQQGQGQGQEKGWSGYLGGWWGRK
ncbi:hypothetical protein CALCODRAFT_432700 [Calocera cornea HHB12733]|uniref:Signal recognition particle subunit SRP68 n=1 Tax=Calocera cornea HHB12733 TaxID=1353952 RepID=A0A165GSK6_9BASI|nr:hypothetical protein CALCODRAFT_432700 [Calocera cornea HHB12733]